MKPRGVAAAGILHPSNIERVTLLAICNLVPEKRDIFSEHLNWEVDWVMLHHKSELTPTLWFAPT